MRRQAKYLVKRRYLANGTALGATPDSTTPPNHPHQRGELALNPALAVQRLTALRAWRPRSGELGTFGQHRFDNPNADVQGQSPCRRDQAGRHARGVRDLRVRRRRRSRRATRSPGMTPHGMGRAGIAQMRRCRHFLLAGGSRSAPGSAPYEAIRADPEADLGVVA